MVNILRAYARKLMHFPVLLVVSGVVAVLMLLDFAFVLADFADTVSWYIDMLRWYMGDIDYLLANFGDIVLNCLYLLASLFGVYFFVSNTVLLGLYLLYATDCIEPTRANACVFWMNVVLSVNVVLAVYTYVTGFLFTSDLSTLFTHLKNAFPVNLTALVVATFVVWYVKKGRAVDFAPALLIAGAVEVAFAALHIAGNIMSGGLGAFSVNSAVGWLVELVSPVMFVFLGYMLIKKFKREPSRFGGYLVNRVNAVRLLKRPKPVKKMMAE